jgi:hypothetical protein
MLRAYADFSGVTLVASHATGGGGGGGDEPCTDCDYYTGSLSGSGEQAQQPNGPYYYVSSSGSHKGWLEGPAGTDFDLYLYKWSGSAWSKVASAETSGSSESIAYSGTSGYYTWLVKSYSGSGTYELWLDTP